MQDVNEVEQEVKERFSSLGVGVRSIKSNTFRGGTFESSRNKVIPVNFRPQKLRCDRVEAASYSMKSLFYSHLVKSYSSEKCPWHP